MKLIHKLELQASNYRKEMQRYRRMLESSGMPKEQVEERLEQAQEFYKGMLNNINKLKDEQK